MKSMRREEAEEIYDSDIVYMYLLDKGKLANALNRHPVDLFIGVTQTKEGKLAFIVIKRTIAAKKIISTFTIEELDGSWMDQFREVLSNLTINEQQQNGGFEE